MVVTEIYTGDWIAVYGADFGNEGAKHITASVKANENQRESYIYFLTSLRVISMDFPLDL